MKKNNGITLVVLIITIIVILILIGSAAYGIIKVIKQAQLMEFSMEAKNVEEIILRERGLILKGTGSKKGQKIVSDMNVVNALTGDTVQIVGSDNNFYYLESKAFENEFDVKVNEGKTDRYYLVNYDEEPYVIPLKDPIIIP
jgi:type II secretory pathway pseudopilin PulG